MKSLYLSFKLTFDSVRAGAGGGIVDRVTAERAAVCGVAETVAREVAVRFFDATGLSTSD